MSALNLFDGIVYINLEKRKDRRKRIEKELKRVCLDPNKTFRIEGYLDELNGCRGCVYSHIKALDFALESNWNNVLVLEDDCVFVQDEAGINSYIQDFLTHFRGDWDVFFLGTRIYQYRETTHPSYLQVHFSLRAHAYIVNGHYISKLRDNFVSTYESMREDLFFTSSLEKSLDMQWVGLQRYDRWYVGTDMIAKQRQSYSDIEKKIRPRR